MKIFTTEQVRKIDTNTIENEPIHSINLMERAAKAFVYRFTQDVGIEKFIRIFAGPGNNGGDALAIARLLLNQNYRVTVYLVKINDQLSKDTQKNFDRLFDLDNMEVHVLNESDGFPLISEDEIIIDGLFGSGLNRPVEGFASKIINHLNASGATIYAIDIPSGLMGEDNSNINKNDIVKADFTFTFEFPFLTFLFPENEIYVGQWEVLPIKLNAEAIGKTETNFYYINKEDIKPILFMRNKFTHKGNFGHALLISGSYGKTGAAVLASKACLRSGVGLLTAFVPKTGFEIMQTAVPEAMLSTDEAEVLFCTPSELERFSAIGIGPGIGKSDAMKKSLHCLLNTVDLPMVIDADAINILAENPEWLNKLPLHSILTPHPKEFERLVGKWENSYHRLQKQIEFAAKYNVFIVLKGAYSSVACPDGTVLFNSTGNPGMATAGSGDALTGIILGLLAQSYSSDEAAVIGVYLHGLAGDMAASKNSQEALIASDIIEYLGKAFKSLRKPKKK